MNYLKATTTDGVTEYFNADKILTISAEQWTEDGNVTKILMGAGLYWRVYTNSIEIVKIENILEV